MQTLPIRPKTSQTYNSVYRRYIFPALQQYELDQIKREYIQVLINSLPPQTGATTLTVIKTIFREAIENSYCEHSPAATVRPPRIQVIPRKFIPLPELVKLEFPKFKTQITFLAMHGLRWGEAAALTENDIHGGRVHVTKSIHGQLKSRAGMRTVPHVSEFKLFPKTPKALRKELAVYGAHIHSLRHTYAYLLKTSGVHVTTAQKLMGHSDPGVTLGIYTRFLDEEIDNAGAAIMDSLRGKSDYLMF